ncbi:hypothetical protein [Salmonella phage SSBI34]|nr:hypothetical protein [Salmonella phage SSBI34]
MYANVDECEAAGLDPKEVERIAKGLSRYGRQAAALGIQIFGGGSYSGSLRFVQHGEQGALVIADLDGMFEGGDGATFPDKDGLLRGEY